MRIGEALGLLVTGAFIGAWVTNYLNYQQFEKIVDSWSEATADDAERWLNGY